MHQVSSLKSADVRQKGESKAAPWTRKSRGRQIASRLSFNACIHVTSTYFVLETVTKDAYVQPPVF